MCVFNTFYLLEKNNAINTQYRILLMQLSSTSRNINLITIFTAAIAVVGFFNTDMFTWSNIIISVVSFYVMSVLGIWMMLHRYYSHRSFEFRNNVSKWFFTGIAVLAGRGSPLGWAYIHRKHHRYSDAENDPHSPKNLGYKLFKLKIQEESNMEIFLVKDIMTKEHLFIHKWYMAIMLVFVSIFLLVNPVMFYFAWALPALVIQFNQNNFNYFGHMIGYRNFDTRDDSRNNVWLFPMLLGEAWHNNHHHDPKNYTTTVKKYELDPLKSFIEIFRSDK